LVPQPGYPVYNIGTLFAGGESFMMPLHPDNNWLPDLSAIPPDIAKRAKLMWLNYPNNPTAATATLEFFNAACEFARRHDILICHDAPYAEIAYDGYRAPSILEAEGAKDVAIEFNSLSKHFNMTGWRIGMAVGNKDAVAALALIKENVDSGVLRAIQFAAPRRCATCPSMARKISREIYKPRMDTVVATLNKIGWDLKAPRARSTSGRRFPMDLMEVRPAFAEHLWKKRLLSSRRDAVTAKRAKAFSAFRYLPDARLAEAMERIEKALK
jgi:LL-diaminopimelate aminotransferase